MADRGKAKDPPALDVEHVVPANDRVLPVRDEDRTVGGDGDVARAEDWIRACDGVLGVHCIPGTVRSNKESLNELLAWLGMQQLIAVLVR